MTPERIVSVTSEVCKICRSPIGVLYERDTHMRDYRVITGCTQCCTRIREAAA